MVEILDCLIDQVGEDETSNSHFDLYISQTVLDEVARGDAEIATRRLEMLSDFPLLEVNEVVQNLAAQFLAKSNLPPKAADDALHIARCSSYSLGLVIQNLYHALTARGYFLCISHTIPKYTVTFCKV